MPIGLDPFFGVLLAGQFEVFFGMSEVRKSYARMVIVAHPDQEVRKAITKHLHSCGWNVISVDTCTQLHSRLQAWPGAKVILSTKMPDESGYLACSKALKSRPTTQVHLLDNQPDSVDESLAAFVGAASIGPMEKILADFCSPVGTRS